MTRQLLNRPDVVPGLQQVDGETVAGIARLPILDDVMGALKKYHDMNKLAMMAVKPGGVFLTCSCTGLVSEADFLETLRRAAWNAGRQLQIVQVSGAAADHPFLVHVPEGRYLKAVFARVL